MAAANRSFVPQCLLIACLAATVSLLAETAAAQTDYRPLALNPAEPRAKAEQLPVPISPSFFSLLRMALAPGRAEVPANRLPFESIRDKQNSPWQGSVVGQLGGVSAADFHRAAREVARQEAEREAQAGSLTGGSDEGYLLPSAQQFIPADPLQAAAAQLRASARNLDGAAADLEDAGKYPEADRMRASAQRLRREARELAKPDTDEIRIIDKVE